MNAVDLLFFFFKGFFGCFCNECIVLYCSFYILITLFPLHGAADWVFSLKAAALRINGISVMKALKVSAGSF